MLAGLANVLFNGIAYGMLLFIIAVGLSVTMGLMGFVNLAHGAFAMAGGYLVLTAMRSWHIPFFAALALTFVVVGAASVVFERLFYARLYKATELEQVLLNLVANAVKYNRVNGTARVGYERGIDGKARVIVSDTGVGLRETAAPGTGLANLRERLQGFYGPTARLELVEVQPHGVRAQIVFDPPAPSAA